MPKCRNCHREITNFDKDICPYCGTPNPIEDGYKTQDMTQFVDPITSDYKLYKSKSKKTMGLLMVFLGAFGVPYFYVGKMKNGIISLLITLILVGGGGSILFLLVPGLHNVLAYLMPLAVMMIVFALFSLRIFHSDSLKDGNGEFLR